MDNRIELCKDWLLHSGIQAKEGGFYAWEDMEKKNYSFLYPEITGYAITLLCFLYKITKDDICITKAEMAAQWIIDEATHPKGSVLTRRYIMDAVEHYSFERGNIYTFDSGMVAFGLLKLYRITNKKEYLDAAKDIIYFLTNNMLKENGLFYPIFDANNNKPYEDKDKWSNQSGSFHCKLSLCLSDLAEIEKSSYHKDIVINLINSSIKHYYKDKRFITNVYDNSSHFHPYCYTIEGLLYYSYKFKINKYKDIIDSAFKWMLKFQDNNGGMPTKIYKNGDNKNVYYQRSDVQAQVLRLYYLINNSFSNFNDGALKERLLQLQNLNKNSKGGVLFGQDEDGSCKMHSNSWCSMFAIQALYLSFNKTYRNLALEYLV